MGPSMASVASAIAPEDPDAWNSFLTGMAKDKTWCGQNMVIAASAFFKRPIVCIDHRHGGSGMHMPFVNTPPRSWNVRNMCYDQHIILGFLPEVHYTATKHKAWVQGQRRPWEAAAPSTSGLVAARTCGAAIQ